MKSTSAGALAIGFATVTSLALATGASAAPTVHQHHGLGASITHATSHEHSALAEHARPASLPSSYSLTNYALSPGDQGAVNSCVSWAVAHTSMGLLESEQGISGGPNAPMYIYSQLVNGQNVGTYPEDNLNIAQQQGVDSASDYTQGDTDYTDTPTQSETDNAAQWRISGYTSLPTGSSLRNAVESAVSSGLPVIFSFDVYQSFEDMSQQTAQDYSYSDPSGEQALGGHEITIVGYTSQGVTIENSWGSGWGDSGYANLSWNFLEGAAQDAHSVGKLVAGS
ncbi:MAG TPA: C1 family peptidase [Pseudonocardiaceae bacterium]